MTKPFIVLNCPSQVQEPRLRVLGVLLPDAVHRPRAPHGQQQVGVRALLKDGRREEEDEQRKGVVLGGRGGG